MVSGNDLAFARRRGGRKRLKRFLRQLQGELEAWYIRCIGNFSCVIGLERMKSESLISTGYGSAYQLDLWSWEGVLRKDDSIIPCVKNWISVARRFHWSDRFLSHFTCTANELGFKVEKEWAEDCAKVFYGGCWAFQWYNGYLRSRKRETL